MNRISTLLLLFSLLAAVVVSAPAQQSDYDIKTTFEERVATLKTSIDSAKSLVALDTLKTAIDSLDRRYAPRSAFLDKARYPQTFAGTMTELRDRHLMAYDRTYLLQTQGIRISDLESQISSLSLRLDTLTIERNKLFQDLAESKRSVAAMRETIRKLATNLQAKDRLLFAMIDSIFIPYGKDLSRVGDMQKEAITHKLEQANVVTRVYDIASDNVTFLEATQLQGKDYAAMMDQYATFSNRWKGLREKMVAVATAPTPSEPGATPAGKPRAGMKGPSITTAPAPKPAPGSEVDSILAVWNERMQKTFWTAIQKEFTDKAIPVNSFSDARTFSESIRSYVQMAKTSGEDPSVFVNDVWKARIDKEWREALTKDAMLGRAEYAALDKLVSELGAQKFDLRFVLYALVVLALAIAVWWFFIRKPKPASTPAAKKS